MILLSLGFQFQGVRDGHASVSMGWESSGFLRESDQRANSTQTFSLGPKFKSEGPYLRTEGDLLGIVQTAERSTMAGEAVNLYLASGYKLSKHHELTLGRRRFDFSQADDVWKLGMIEPRFLWDPTRPQGVGMTGLFYKFETKRTRFVAFGSPLSIPERGFPVRQDSGTLATDNPFSAPIYDSVRFSDQSFPIRYDIKYPPLKDLLLNPNGALSARWSPRGATGWWIHGLGGVLPVNQVNISADVGFLPQESTAFADIYPRVLTRRVALAETGYRNKRISVWGSRLEDAPFDRSVPSNWNTPAWGRSSVSAVGGSVAITGRLSIKGSALWIDEKTATQTSDSASDFNINLPARYDYKKAYRVGGHYQMTERHAFQNLWTYDRAYSNSIGSFDYLYFLTQKDSAWALQVGADFFVANNRDGFIGAFKGNDRFRGSVRYVF